MVETTAVRRGLIVLVALLSLPLLILYFSVGLRTGTGCFLGTYGNGCHCVPGSIDYGFLSIKLIVLFFAVLISYIKLRQRN